VRQLRAFVQIYRFELSQVRQEIIEAQERNDRQAPTGSDLAIFFSSRRLFRRRSSSICSCLGTSQGWTLKRRPSLWHQSAPGMAPRVLFRQQASPEG